MNSLRPMIAAALRSCANVVARPGVLLGVDLENYWRVECFGRDGRQKWVDEFENLVTTEGKNHILSSTFDAATQVTQWYVGLKDTGSAAAGDTMASHAGWVEMGGAVPLFSNATRPALTLGSASSGSIDNSSNKAVFTIDAADTVYGAFVTSNNTLDGATGTLYAVGDFSSPRALESGDTLNVTVTLTAS